MQLKKLIEEASGIAGSQSTLAEILGITKQNITDIKHGRRPCSTRLLEQIAEVAGYEPTYFIVQSVIQKLEQSENPNKKAAAEEIKKAVGMHLHPQKTCFNR